jgi:hypothetical protein
MTAKPNTGELLKELYEWCSGLNDFRPDSPLARKVRAALASPPSVLMRPVAFRVIDSEPVLFNNEDAAMRYAHRHHLDYQGLYIRDGSPSVPGVEREKIAPVQGYSAGIPWSMHLRAYDAYCKRYSPQRALIEGGCRGGFGVGELDMFIPGWREELSEITKLKTENARLLALIEQPGEKR